MSIIQWMRPGKASLLLTAIVVAAGCGSMSSEETSGESTSGTRTSSASGSYEQCAGMTGAQRTECERRAAHEAGTGQSPGPSEPSDTSGSGAPNETEEQTQSPR
ncbi:MAG TPA: hypothetical protein VHK24_05870 [Steroidobacter sp.]|jgi:uncharacterized protein YceK|nr:hypothetical protein [Steroidobacter sp.]